MTTATDAQRAPLSAPAASNSESSLKRLDQSIERCRLQGAFEAPKLSTAERRLLADLVDLELRGGTGKDETSLEHQFTAGCRTARWRFRRSLRGLLSRELARRDRNEIRPTVAGLAALTAQGSPAIWEAATTQQLRGLRREEIGSI